MLRSDRKDVIKLSAIVGAFAFIVCFAAGFAISDMAKETPAPPAHVATETDELRAELERHAIPGLADFGADLCEFEDDPGPCFWDADIMGNGEGESFFVDRFGVIYYPQR